MNKKDVLNNQLSNKTKSKKSGTFSAKDKLGTSVILEWEMFDSLDPKYPKKMESTRELLTDSYASIEFQFLQKHPEAVNNPKEFLWHPLTTLFESGVENVDWEVVKEKVVDSLRQLFKMNFSEHLEKENSCMFHVVAKDEKSAAPLGVMQCLISPKYAEGDVRVHVLGVAPVAQRRGLGKLLMSSVLKIIPETKRIFLSTRKTNANAIKAYSAWGFTQDHKHEGCEYLSDEHWVSFEYVNVKSCVLQKVAEYLIFKK